MDYQISEDELNRLATCRDLLDLIADLSSQCPEKATIAVSGLLGLVNLQHTVMRETIRTVELRGAAEFQLNRSLAQPGGDVVGLAGSHERLAAAG